jgi:murein DD-endopeptidase MepM/ murein hydrolase activator NlpD
VGPSFLIVNREPEYLKSSALHHAKAYDLEWALQELYASNDWAAAAHPGDKKTQGRRSKKRNRLKQPTMRSSAEPPKAVLQQKELVPKNPIFSWPLAQFYISSKFGPRKKVIGHTEKRVVWGFHRGIDMVARKGTPVMAGAPGIIIEAGSNGGYGNTVVIAHSKKFKTRYAHLSQVLVTLGE